MNTEATIEIKGEGFSLVSFNLNFVKDLYISWLKDTSVNRYLIKPNKKVTKQIVVEYCRNLMESENNIFLAILASNGNNHIGNVRLGPIDFDSKVCKFSMMIGNKDFHGKGYGTKIVSSCIKYAFNELNMNKFYLDVIAENLSAIRTYEKNGLAEEGLLKNHVMIRNKYHDLKIMSVFNPNF